jgi:hypothetical protein
MVTGDEIELRGQPLRVRKSFALPLRVECDVIMKELPDRGGDFRIIIFSSGAPSDIEPQRQRRFRLSIEDPREEPVAVAPVIDQWDGSLRRRALWKGCAVDWKLGGAYHLKRRRESWRISINNHSFEVMNFGVHYDKVLLDLWHWQPSTRWQVRWFSVY